MLMLMMVVFGCSKSDDTPAAASSATITGTVSGTTIVAIDENNTEQARMEATGTPKTFTITVPIGHTYRFYLIENENTLEEKIFPLYYAGTNAFSIASVGTIDFGFVDTTNGVTAIPANNPLLVAGVSAAAENKLVPEIVLGPTPPAGTSLSDLVAGGLSSLQTGGISKAQAYFKAAVTNYPSDTTNDGDTAKFFYAVTMVAGVNLYSDGDSTGTLNSVGDILDRAGCSAGGRSFDNSTMTCPDTLPSTTPTGSNMQAFLYNVIRPELEAALAYLSGVQSSFTKTWTNPIDSKSYISDYGDVLVYKAAIRGALAAINTQYAYVLDANIATEVNNKSNTVQAFLSGNPTFLTRASVYSTYLTTADGYLSAAADDLIAAITKIQTRNTVAYLINLQDKTNTELDNAKSSLSAFKTSLSLGSPRYQLVFPGDDATLETSDDVKFSPSLFFDGLNLRSLLPSFTDNTPGLFPDATMGGVIVQGVDVNDDKNSNGIPDILE
jgi:hypothetical protein